MKLIVSLYFLVSSVVAFGQISTVLYDVKEIKIDHSLAYLDVMPFTPKNNYLKIKLKKTYKVCNETSTREVFGKSIEYCGYDLVKKTICSGPFRNLPNVDYYSDEPLLNDNSVVSTLRDLIGGPNYRPTQPDNRSRCKKIELPEARECNYTETFCSLSEEKVVTEYRDFKLKLINFPDRSLIRLEIKEDETLDVKVLNVYSDCVSTKTYFRNGKVVGAKIKLRYSCYAALSRY